MTVDLAVIETHPIQYHAPVYALLEAEHGIRTAAIYASDFSVSGYRDPEFGVDLSWSDRLLEGYRSVFLERVADGGARDTASVSARGLTEALTDLDPAAILLTGYSPRFYRDAGVAAFRSRKPVLLRAETTDHVVHRSGMKRLVRDAALRRLYKRCAALLYVGQRSQAHLARLGVARTRLFFSPYCVDTSWFENDESARAEHRAEMRAEWRDDTIVVAFSGKLVTRKAPDLLVRAVKILAPEHRDRIELLFIGAGDMEPMLKDLAAAPPAVPARFIGFQRQEELSSWYHAADLLALPSVAGETWGLVVNEALHHGLPAVVSDAVGCAPDLIVPGVTGETAVAGSVDSLSSALQRATALIRRAEVRAACREQVSAYTSGEAAAGIARALAAVRS